MFVPSKLTFPLLPLNSPCQQHDKRTLQCKYNYRFDCRSGIATLQGGCEHCGGWKNLTDEEIFGRTLAYTKEESYEIWRFVYDKYPSHMAKLLYKRYRRALLPWLSTQANYAREQANESFVTKIFRKIFQ